MGLSPAEIDERVHEAASFVGIPDELLLKSPFELSGGQKRRVAIAGVISMRPDVLILDEPTAGLDPAGREEILGHIREFHRSRGSTVVLVSHSMEDISRYADRIIVMDRAAPKFTGTPAEIFAKSRELTEIGLDVPMVTSVFLRLKELGLPIDASVYTIEYGLKKLLELDGAAHA
jgi:energy-coupling factor transport system ATP-binding protein